MPLRQLSVHAVFEFQLAASLFYYAMYLVKRVIYFYVCMCLACWPARHRDADGGFKFCLCYVLFLNITPLIRQLVGESQCGLLR